MTWNNRPGSGAREVRDAFLNKKPKRKGAFESTGTEYIVHRFAIAKHVEVSIAEAVAHKLLTNTELVRLAFRFGECKNQVILNHLNLFSSLDAYWYGDEPTMNGKVVKPNTWYTIDEIEALPARPAKPEPVYQLRVNARRDFLTLPLFMNKFQRLVERAIVEGGATIVQREPKRVGHSYYRIRLPNGSESRITVSSSPKVEEHAVDAVRRQVKRLCEQ